MVDLFDRDDFRQEERAVYRPNSNGYLASLSLSLPIIHTQLASINREATGLQVQSLAVEG